MTYCCSPWYHPVSSCLIFYSTHCKALDCIMWTYHFYYLLTMHFLSRDSGLQLGVQLNPVQQCCAWSLRNKEMHKWTVPWLNVGSFLLGKNKIKIKAGVCDFWAQAESGEKKDFECYQGWKTHPLLLDPSLGPSPLWPVSLSWRSTTIVISR